MAAFLKEYETLLWVAAIVSAALFVLTIVSLPLVLAWLPEDYFTRRRTEHPFTPLRILWLVLKNLLGWILILLGLAMLLLPGQGLLTVFVGLVLISFPGKRRFQIWLVNRPKIASSIHWIRNKAGKKPLKLKGPHDAEGGQANSKSQ